MFFPWIISRIFEPFFVVLPATIVLYTFRSGLTLSENITFLSTLFCVFFLPAFIGMLISLKLKKVNNWDVSDRRQRVKVLGVLLALITVASTIIRKQNNPVLNDFLSLYLLWFAGFFLITLFYKISVHMGMLVLAIGIVLHWYGIAYWPILFLIPLVAWSRVVLKRHSIGQVLAGIVYSTVILLIGIYFQYV